MRTTTNPQMGLLDGLMANPPANAFLDKLDKVVDWKPIEEALWRMYPAKTGRPPYPVLVLFKMCILQHCYNLSDPQYEEQVRDRLSWKKFIGHWKVRYKGRDPNRLELEFKSICWNLKRLVKLIAA